MCVSNVLLNVVILNVFSFGCGDVFVDVGCRSDDFSFVDVVVFQEDDFEEVINVFIIVYN